MIAQPLGLGRAAHHRTTATVIPLSLAAHAAATALVVVAPLLSRELPPVAGPPPGPYVTEIALPRRAPRVDVTKLTGSTRDQRNNATISNPHLPPTAPQGGLPIRDILDGERSPGPFIPGLLPCEGDCDDDPLRSFVIQQPFPTPTPETEYIRVSSFSPPRKVTSVAPLYPELARAAHIQGVVTVECTIAPTGRVENATATDGPPLLREAAVAAVQQWRYTPTLMNGVEVGVLLTVHVNFRLQ